MQKTYIGINNTLTKVVKFINSPDSENILILHGWGGSSDSWLTVGEKLQKSGFNVFIPDLPGFGETKLDKVYTLNDYSSFVIALVSKLNIKDNFILLGHSNGGAISIKLVNSGIIKPRLLILNNSAGIRNNSKITLKRKILQLVVILVKPLKFLPGFTKLRKLFYRAIGSHDYLNAEKNSLLKETYKNMIGEDLTQIIPNINLDTLLIRGTKDTYTPLWMGNKMRNMIKKSKIIQLLGETHGIHLKNPDLLVKTIVDNI